MRPDRVRPLTLVGQEDEDIRHGSERSHDGELPAGPARTEVTDGVAHRTELAAHEVEVEEETEADDDQTGRENSGDSGGDSVYGGRRT